MKDILTNRQRIAKRIEEENDKKPSHGFRLRKYVDVGSGLEFNRFKTYAENKADFLKVFSICVKTNKNIWSVYKEVVG